LPWLLGASRQFDEEKETFVTLESLQMDYAQGVKVLGGYYAVYTSGLYYRSFTFKFMIVIYDPSQV
jgi:hypothetical protein